MAIGECLSAGSARDREAWSLYPPRYAITPVYRSSGLSIQGKACNNRLSGLDLFASRGRLLRFVRPVILNRPGRKEAPARRLKQGGKVEWTRWGGHCEISGCSIIFGFHGVSDRARQSKIDRRTGRNCGASPQKRADGSTLPRRLRSDPFWPLAAYRVGARRSRRPADNRDRGPVRQEGTRPPDLPGKDAGRNARRD